MNENKIEAAAEILIEVCQEADNAFWAIVAERYPNIKTGDFPPDALFERNNNNHKDISLWLELNKGDE